MIHFLLAAATVALAAPPKPEYGILLMAHGGMPSWNKEVLALQAKLKAEAPVEVAFGMADFRELDKAVRRLESRGVKKIVAVPLFVSSHSEVLDQTRFVLGLAEKPSKALLESAHAHVGREGSKKRVQTKLPLVLTPALDDHPLVAEILLERARALSKSPAKETVFLVGHGPVDEEANTVWLETMTALGRVLKDKGKFKAVEVATLRDDSPSTVKEKAVADLRGRVLRAGGQGGRVVVLPLLIARGGIESHIVKALDSLFYLWDGRTLAPHPNLERWVLESARQGAKQENMRLFK